MYVTSYISLDNFLCINFPQTKAGKCSKAWHGPGEMTEGTRTGAVGVIKELVFSGLHKLPIIDGFLLLIQGTQLSIH